MRHALPLWQRLRRRWRAWRGAGLVKSHVVHFVDIGEARFKRVRFADGETARAIAWGLERMVDTGCFPALVSHHGSQVWVDYVSGQPPQLDHPADRARLIEFFVTLYVAGTSSPLTDLGPFSARLVRDLDFLCRAGVVSREKADQLRDLESRMRPPRAWVGQDYIDPLAKNFIVQDGRAVAIDIEALAAGTPLGAGLAKASLRWPFDPSDEVVRRVANAGGPDLTAQMPWTRLCFLGDYFKQKLLQGKPGYVKVEALDRLLRRQTAETPP